MTKREKLYREALETIAMMPLPTFEHPTRGPMVPVENADYLRTMAKEALRGPVGGAK